jgi:hypothetical protein
LAGGGKAGVRYLLDARSLGGAERKQHGVQGRTRGRKGEIDAGVAVARYGVPEPPIVANGVVYALSNGENTQSIHESGRLLTSQERASAPVGNAVLYAFQADTGKQLFSSERAISGFSHFSGLAIANGHVYVVTFQNVLYSFGLGGMEQ